MSVQKVKPKMANPGPLSGKGGLLFGQDTQTGQWFLVSSLGTRWIRHDMSADEWRQSFRQMLAQLDQAAVGGPLPRVQ